MRLIAIVLAWLCITHANADSIFKPSFDNNRVFLEETPSETLTVYGVYPFKVRVIQSALAECQLNPDAIRHTFESALEPDSHFLRALSKVWADPIQEMKSTRFEVIIDSLGEKKNEHAYFIYFDDQRDLSLIVLDCSPMSQLFWPSELAHELVHLFLRKKNLEPWFEESIAQMIEEESGGLKPSVVARNISSKTLLPPLTELSPLMPSRDNYAMTYWFGKFLKQHFGDWQILAAMAGVTPASPSDCESFVDGLEKVACRGKSFLLASSPESSLPRAVNIMTRKGLLRYFSLAFVLNRSDVEFGFLPNWSGYHPRKNASEGLIQSVLPSQFFILSAKDYSKIHRSINPALEAYLIEFDSSSHKVSLIRLSADFQIQASTLSLGQIMIVNTAKETHLLKFP